MQLGDEEIASEVMRLVEGTGNSHPVGGIEVL